MISGRAGEHLVERFATTTSAAGSDVKPEIATDRDKFAALARQLEVYANRLGDSAEEGDKRKEKASDVDTYSSEHVFHMMLADLHVMPCRVPAQAPMTKAL